MSSAAFPSVISAVMTTVEALPDVRVTRGQDITQETGDVVMVGVQTYGAQNYGRGMAATFDSSGTFDQQFQTFGGARSETGRVYCLAASRNGDSDLDAACSAVFDLISGLEAAFRADNSLGVTTLEYLVTQMQTGDVRESLNNDGALAVISFAILYTARI